MFSCEKGNRKFYNGLICESFSCILHWTNVKLIKLTVVLNKHSVYYQQTTSALNVTISPNPFLTNLLFHIKVILLKFSYALLLWLPYMALTKELSRLILLVNNGSDHCCVHYTNAKYMAYMQCFPHAIDCSLHRGEKPKDN